MIGYNMKQLSSVQKALMMVIVTASIQVADKKIPREKAWEFIEPRFKDIQRKYGLNVCLKVAHLVWKRLKEVKTPMVKVTLKNKVVEIPLLYHSLEKYLDLNGYLAPIEKHIAELAKT
jgi:hypothetical protein